MSEGEAGGQEPQPGDAEGQKADASTQGQEPDAKESGGQTPEPRTFDEAYVKQLRREASDLRQKARASETELERLRDRDKSDTERLTGEVTRAEGRATEAEAKLLRYEVAASHSLDLSAAAFLKGTTQEEIESSADELVKLLAAQGKPPASTSFDGGVRKTPAETKSPEEEHNLLLLRASGRVT